jgi:hypothetical protein
MGFNAKPVLGERLVDDLPIAMQSGISTLPVASRTPSAERRARLSNRGSAHPGPPASSAPASRACLDQDRERAPLAAVAH